MCEHCNHISTYAKAALVDPMRMVSLRNAFARDMKNRFTVIKNAIIEAIVDKDVFGLTNNTIQANVQPRQFSYATTGDKVEAFMAWLNELVKDNLLSVGRLQQLGTGLNSAWTNLYIEDTYKRGLLRAQAELKKVGYKLPKSTTVDASFNTPFHLDRVGALYTRVYSELKGITAAMDTQISKVLSQAMMDGDNPRRIARKLTAVIEGGGDEFGITDTLGRYIPAQQRAQTLVRTEMTRAYHQANIQEMKNWGVVGVDVLAEWSTAADKRVCPICEDLQGSIYTMDEIMNLIPKHPNCRCLALPAIMDADTSGGALPLKAGEESFQKIADDLLARGASQEEIYKIFEDLYATRKGNTDKGFARSRADIYMNIARKKAGKTAAPAPKVPATPKTPKVPKVPETPKEPEVPEVVPEGIPAEIAFGDNKHLKVHPKQTGTDVYTASKKRIKS